MHSRTLSEHYDNLRITLTAYQNAGLKLNPKKCTFYAASILYLGHVLDENGIRPPDTFKEAVTKWTIPRFKTDARAWNGFVNVSEH